MSTAVIVAAGGRGVRFGAATPKQLLTLGGRAILTRSVELFGDRQLVSEVVVVVPAEHLSTAATLVPLIPGVTVQIVAGGERRQDSVAAGFRAVSPGAEIVLVHDAARPFVPPALIRRVIAAASAHGAAIPALRARDTVKRARQGPEGTFVRETLPREEIFLAQTPQAFRRDVLARAIELGASGAEATDEARLAELAGFDVQLVEGDPDNIKITTPGDLAFAQRVLAARHAPDNQETAREAPAAREPAPASPGAWRIGFGYDSHRLTAGRPLILGGVRIPFSKGLTGHSDADAVAHAVTDAVLGAGALGDIGRMYPETDARWRNANSMELLADAVRHAAALGVRVVNVDVTVIAEQPKIGPHAEQMCGNLAAALGIARQDVSVKGKTNEGLDAAGRGEAIVVHAVALVVRDN